MRYQDLFEGRNSKCIVVDVQPAYTASPPVDNPMYWNEELMAFLNKQGPILAFVNADDQMLTNDTITSVQQFWQDKGFNPDRWNSTEIVDKGYGYFRAWMDQAVQPDVIIKVIRTMYQQKVTDSRELFDGDESDNYQEQMTALLGNAWEEWMISDPLLVEWTSVSQLKKYNGAYIMGGGRDECLREVELLMNAFNIKYKRIEDFVYG
jgi:hypothetical protein